MELTSSAILELTSAPTWCSRRARVDLSARGRSRALPSAAPTPPSASAPPLGSAPARSSPPRTLQRYNASVPLSDSVQGDSTGWFVPVQHASTGLRAPRIGPVGRAILLRSRYCALHHRWNYHPPPPIGYDPTPPIGYDPTPPIGYHPPPPIDYHPTPPIGYHPTPPIP
eukprot:736120-Rhodomonas_salina.2